MNPFVDTNILVQYIARTDSASVEQLTEYIISSTFESFIILEPILFETFFVLEYKLGFDRALIKKEIGHMMTNPFFIFQTSFDLNGFLTTYVKYPTLDVVDTYLLYKKKEGPILTLDKQLRKVR